MKRNTWLHQQSFVFFLQDAVGASGIKTPGAEQTLSRWKELVWSRNMKNNCLESLWHDMTQTTRIQEPHITFFCFLFFFSPWHPRDSCILFYGITSCDSNWIKKNLVVLSMHHGWFSKKMQEDMIRGSEGEEKERKRDRAKIRQELTFDLYLLTGESFSSN